MGKRNWDKFDEEAEREGAAYSRQVTTQIIKNGVGKGITKQRNMHSNIINKVETRLLRKHLTK